MGWLVVIAAPQVAEAIGSDGMIWLIAGGLSYTVGAHFLHGEKHGLQPRYLAPLRACRWSVSLPGRRLVRAPCQPGSANRLKRIIRSESRKEFRAGMPERKSFTVFICGSALRSVFKQMEQT